MIKVGSVVYNRIHGTGILYASVGDFVAVAFYDKTQPPYGPIINYPVLKIGKRYRFESINIKELSYVYNSYCYE